MRSAIIILMLLYPFSLGAAGLELDLNGFRLQQFVTIPEKVYGPPFQTVDADPSEVRAYRIDDEAYMVIGHHKKYPHNISMLQLTGSTNKALPFKGLMLGDSKEKVIAVLGKPSSTKEIESPKVTVLYYDDTNYTVEIDEKARLYSILISTNQQLLDPAEIKGDGWAEFKAAVTAKDFLRIAETLRPDMEIYKDGKILSIQTRYSDFIKDPEKEFVDAFIGKTDSVLQEILQTEPEGELRLVKDFGVGRVFKFRKGSILEEVSFFAYNGKYRVYEIAFRNRIEADTKPAPVKKENKNDADK